MKKSIIFYSSLTLLALFLILFLSNTYLIQWDTVGYYLYLPANFIWHDPYLTNYEYANELITQKYGLSSTYYQVFLVENGKYLIKYTSGIAILTLPFFLVTHYIVSNLTSFPPDGFSYPYHLGFYIATLFYLTIGIFFFLKVLRKIFDYKVTTITFLALLFGTNIIYLLEIPPVVHVFAFTFYSIFLYYSIKWHENQSFKNTFFLGLSFGFILAIRPTDGIIMVVFLLWNVTTFTDLKEKIKWFFVNKKALIAFIFSILIPVTPQIIYWTLLTGKPIINSYMNPNEGLDWFSPHTINFLFSFRKGWIIYTPMVLLLIPAFVYMYKRNKQFFYATFVFLILSVYLHSSWTCWWYAESYGQRSMLQSYVILSIPFGFFIHHLLNKRKHILLYSLLGFFAVFNLFKYYQFRMQIIHPSRMTREYYFATFFHTKPPSEEIQKLLLLERPLTSEVIFKNRENYRLAKKMQIIYEQMFDIPKDRLHLLDSCKNKYFVLMDSNYIYTPAYKLKISEITSAEYAYIIFSTSYLNYHSSVNNPLYLVVHMTHNGKIFEYKTFETKDNFKDDDSLKMQNIVMPYLPPELVRSNKDEVVIYFWLRGKNKVLVGPIDIEVWEPK